MKNLGRAIIVLTIMFFCINANAQYFIGGNFNFNTEGGTYDDGTNKTDKDKISSFGLGAKGGIFLDDKLAVGGAIGFSSTKEDNKTTDTEITGSGIGIGAFARYYAIEFGKFSVFAEAGLGFANEKTDTKVAGTSTGETKTNTIEFSIVPALAFDLSESFMLEAQLNFLDIGFSTATAKTSVPGGSETKDKTNNFGLMANSSNAFTTGALTVGFIYKF